MAKSYRYDPWRFLKIGFATLCGVAVISTLVYYALGIYYDAHWSLFECLFMVVMTMSTLGNDVLHLEGRPLGGAHDVSGAGRHRHPGVHDFDGYRANRGRRGGRHSSEAADAAGNRETVRAHHRLRRGRHGRTLHSGT